MNIIEVSLIFTKEIIGGGVFLGFEELARSIEPVDLGYGFVDRS
jgi:hypothetical protein